MRRAKREPAGLAEDRRWVVTFRLENDIASAVMPSPERPADEDIAQFLRDRLFPPPRLIPSAPRGCAEPTVHQLRKCGVEILGAEEQADDPSDPL